MDTSGWPFAEGDELFADCPFGLARVSVDRRLVRVNAALAGLRGVRPETMVGRSCCDLFGGSVPRLACPAVSSARTVGQADRGTAEGADASEDEARCAGCPIAGCLERGEVQQLERPVGDRLVRVSAWPTRLGGGVAGAVLLVADISGERTAREQLLRMQRLAAIGAMTAGVSHELKNPLTTIEGFAHLLRRRGDLPAEAVAQLDRLFGETQRCTRIVSRLLKFARQRDDGKAVLDLNSVVRDAVDLMRYQGSASRVAIRETYHGVPLLVFGDSLGLQQVVQNIVRNALDAIGETRRGGSLDVCTRPEDGRAVVELANDGPPLADTARIFQAFYTTKKPDEGTGLGLSMSQAIVQGHGGTIEAENTPRGVLFRIVLPTHSPHPSPLR